MPSVVIRPTVQLRPVCRPCACGFGLKSSVATASRTRWRVSGRIRPLPPRALEAVPTLTPASRATTNATQGLAYNGGGWSTVTYAPTSSGWGKPTGTATVDVNLRAGYHTTPSRRDRPTSQVASATPNWTTSPSSGPAGGSAR